MKKVAIALISIALYGCGQYPDIEQAPVVVDEELLVYAQRFEEEIGVSTSGISIFFEELEGDTVGLCTISSLKREIRVDPTFWAEIEDHVKEELLYHELGHCAMYLDHDETMSDNYCPLSVMYPYVLDRCYFLYINDYKDDLKSRIGTGTLAGHKGLSSGEEKTILDTKNMLTK